MIGNLRLTALQAYVIHRAHVDTIMRLDHPDQLEWLDSVAMANRSHFLSQ